MSTLVIQKTLSNSIDDECHHVLISSLISIIIFTSLTIILAFLIDYFAQPLSEADLVNFTQKAHPQVNPEPTERSVFQIMVLLTPFIAFISYLLTKRLSFLHTLFFRSRTFNGYVVISIIGLILVNTWAVLLNYIYKLGFGSRTILFFSVTALLLYVYTLEKNTYVSRFNKMINNHFKTIFLVLTILCILIALSFRLFDWKVLVSLSKYPLYNYSGTTHHLNTVLYYLSLAESGHYSNFSSTPQYGLYSFYLKPIFRLLDLNLFSFTFIMTLLYFFAVVAVITPIFRLIQNNYIKLLLPTTLCAIQGSLIQVSIRWDPYFQYYPIRFFLPALSILFLYLVLNSKYHRTQIAASASLILGLLSFWNFDSSITTILAWLGFFLLLALVETLKHRSLCNAGIFQFLVVILMTGLGVAMITIIFISCDMGNTSFNQFFQPLKIFYVSGFYMLPIPTYPHPWMAVAAVYLSVVTVTLPSIFIYGLHCSKRRLIIFYIAILGTGLFAYYQGRSHNFSLPSVAWPAVLCCFMACDWCFTNAFEQRRSGIKYLSLPFVLICVSLTLALAGNSSWYLKRLEIIRQSFLNNELNKNSLLFSDTVNQLSTLCVESPDSVLIFHSAESLFYIESGLNPPFPLPSFQEQFVLSKQWPELKKVIVSGKVRHIFTSSYWPDFEDYKKFMSLVKDNYNLEEVLLLEHWTLKEPNLSKN